LYLLYLLAVSLDISEEELARVRMLVVLGGAIVAGFACLQLLHGVGWGARASIVVGTSQTNPNKLAATLIVPFFLGIGGFLSSVSKRGKVSWGVLTAPIAIVMCLSMSRGALLALAVGMLVFVIRSSSSARVIGTISITFALLIASSPPLLERIETSLTSRGEGRIDIWQTGFAAVREYGVIGAGLDNFPIAYNKFAGSSNVFRGYGRAPHNIFLLTEVELGIVGFFLLLLAVISQLRDAISKKKDGLQISSISTVGYEAGCWGMLAMGLSEDNLWIKSFWIAWMLLAIAVRVNRRNLLEGREWE
jgi:O-antigen ligase